MSLVIHAIPVDGPGGRGIHLLWSGPPAWVYSPGGWRLQRRELDRRRDGECVTIGGASLTTLRETRELRTAIGLASLRSGVWPDSTEPGAPAAGSVAEVITLELDRPAPFVRVISSAKWNFIVALRAGKVVAGGTVQKAPVTLDCPAPGIDTVVVYTLGLGDVMICRGRGATDESWQNAPVIARLQLPLRELMPELTSADDEIKAARTRLLPGETVDDQEFAEIAGLLRLMVGAVYPPRPIDLSLLMRDSTDDDFDELGALDPLRSLLLVPRWRRALGFAFFDADPALVPGQSYEYRLTGAFPADEATDRVIGFHTIPSTTALPADFHLGDVRVRLAQPPVVERVTLVPGATRTIARRAIALREPEERWWLGLDLESESAVIDFPTGVSKVVLELGGPHSLSFAAGQPWGPLGAYAPVPAGSSPHLSFPTPIHQLRLKGRALLCAVRIDGGGGATLLEQPVTTAPVTLVDTPRPEPPLSIAVTNLQTPVTISTTDIPSLPVPPPQALGFQIAWTPAPLPGVIGWPPDLGAAPPLDATMFQIEHQQVPNTTWTPVLEDDNLTTGNRSAADQPIAILPGGDLLQVFPETRPPATDATAVQLLWRDVFDMSLDDVPPRRPVPPTGTMHRYRVRPMDAIGRPSVSWRESAALRLEKHNQPPLPTGPDPRPARSLERAAPSGPQVRVLDRDDPDLTTAERALLGSHRNAILLTWGWHAEQRAQDPSAKEFRVYASRHRLDAQRARINAVTDLGPGRYSVDIHLDRAVVTDGSAGLTLDAGYPFHLRTHGAGLDIQATVQARVANPDGTFPKPALGPALFPLRLTPDATRGPAWDARVEIVPIVADSDVYVAAPLFDMLDLSADHPRDEVLVGVSAADAEPYVDDPLAPAASRPGNEGAIAVVPVAARYRGRPAVVDVPALDPVPSILTPFPGPRPLFLHIDVSPILAGSGFGAGQRAMPERVLDDEVFRAYRLEGGRLLARVPDPRSAADVEVEVVVPNATDRAAVVAAFEAGEVAGLSDARLVFLAASHPYGGRLFTAASAVPVVLPAFDDTLPNRSARLVYRLRAVDPAGHLSAGGVTLKGIVRVPSAAPLPAPVRAAVVAGDPPQRLRLDVRGDADVTHLLVFTLAHGPLERATAAADLMWRAAPTPPASIAARVRLPDGALLIPTVTSLADAGVEGTPPYRTAALDVPPPASDRITVWVCTATRDGWLSPLAGPWTL